LFLPIQYQVLADTQVAPLQFAGAELTENRI
jgi:hypothetical protein